MQFLELCLSRAGADSMITPREMLRDYMTVLNILMQNPTATFQEVVGQTVTLRHESDDSYNPDDPDNAWKPTASEKSTEPTPAQDAKKYTPDDLDF